MVNQPAKRAIESVYFGTFLVRYLRYSTLPYGPLYCTVPRVDCDTPIGTRSTQYVPLPPYLYSMHGAAALSGGCLSVRRW